jgi:hypothetical protein
MRVSFDRDMLETSCQQREALLKIIFQRPRAGHRMTILSARDKLSGGETGLQVTYPLYARMYSCILTCTLE